MPKILVVDDQPTARDLLVTLLGYAGHDVIEASDGAEALNAARAERPDLIITDILMPTMDGYEFIRQLRGDPAISGTNVVFYSASYHDREAAKLAKKCGVSHILHKPSDPQEMLRTVQSALGLEAFSPAEPARDFDREHLRLITDKLSEKVKILEMVSSRLEVLVGLSQEAALIRDVRVLMDKFCCAARDILSAEYAGVLLFDSKGEKAEYFTISGTGPEVREQIETPVIAGIFRKLVDSIVPLHDKDFGADWRSRIFRDHPLVYSFLGTAIRGSGDCYGVIYVANKVGADEFDREESALLKTLSAQLAVCCESLRLYAQLQDRAADLEHYTRQLKHLSNRLMEVREHEQRHIARELHDEIGPGLTALKLHLQAAEKASGSNGAASQITESLQITETTLQQVRSLSLDLRPSVLDDLGLVPALRWLLDRQAGLGGFTAEFVADPPALELPVECRTTCFRIVQESLTNILRHARAKSVSVRLLQNEEGLFLSIIDDGVGFAVSQARKTAGAGRSIGILGMEERANLAGGQLAIDSVPGQGTNVRVRFPHYGRTQT